MYYKIRKGESQTFWPWNVIQTHIAEDVKNIIIFCINVKFMEGVIEDYIP